MRLSQPFEIQATWYLACCNWKLMKPYWDGRWHFSSKNFNLTGSSADISLLCYQYSDPNNRILVIEFIMIVAFRNLVCTNLNLNLFPWSYFFVGATYVQGKNRSPASFTFVKLGFRSPLGKSVQGLLLFDCTKWQCCNDVFQSVEVFDFNLT